MSRRRRQAFVDGELMTGNELPEWWDANNVTFAIDIPSAVVIRIAALLGWEVPVEDALASANDCLLANVASLGAHQMVPPTDTGLKAPAAAKLEETMPVQAHSADDKKGEAGDYQDHNSWVIWVVVGMVLVCVAVVAVAVGIIRKLGKRKEADARRVEEGFSHLHDVSAKPLASYRAAPAAVSQEMAISSMWDFMSTRSTGNSNCSYPGAPLTRPLLPC